MSAVRFGTLAALALAGAVLSGLLLLEHHGVASARAAVEQLCGEAADSGCGKVSQSAYSTVGPITLASVGAFFYVSVLLLVVLGLVAPSSLRLRLAGGLFLLMAAALAVDVALFAIQAFRIGAFCNLCLSTYGVNLASLALLLPARSQIRSLPGLWREVQGRMVLSTWFIGAVVVLLSVFSVDLALGQLGATGEGTMLGSGLQMLGGPSDTERIEAELREARAEVERLRAILADPHKVEQYQAARAAQEFEDAPREDLALEEIPFKGPANAPIRVVEFSDFLCPYCRSLAGAFQNYLPQSEGRVAIYFKNYPLDRECNPELSRTVHPGACELALGAICAQEQGEFWPYHDKVFEAPPEDPSRSDVVALAASAGLDGSNMAACMGSEEARSRLAAQIDEARRLGITGTPTVYINGKKLPRIGDFLQAIESESRRLGLPPPSPGAN